MNLKPNLNPFKGKFGKADDNIKVELTDNSDDKTNNGVKETKDSSFKHLRKKVRIKLKLRPHSKSDDEHDNSASEAGGLDVKAEKKAEKQRLAKEKKILKELEKKEKEKQRAEKKKNKQLSKTGKKEAQDQDASSAKQGLDNDDTGEDDVKAVKFPIIPVVILSAALVIGGGIFAAMAFLNQPTTQDLLLKATLLRTEEKYGSAQKIYEKILKKDNTLVQAYLGLADSLEKQNKISEAIDSLNIALEPTGNDPVILAKIDLIKPLLAAEPAQDSSEASASEEESASEDESPQPESQAEESVSEAEPPEPPEPAVPIVWKDAALEKAIRGAMNIPDGTVITDQDVSKIAMIKILGSTHSTVKQALNSFNKINGYEIDGVMYEARGTIRTLDDLAHFKNLRKLTIGYNSIEDISGIAGLPHLETLGLYCNDINDVTALANLKTLKYIYIYGNRIANITPLTELSELSELWINSNNISDISAVKNLKNLTELHISNNYVVDISAVSGLTKLQSLYADHNRITNISPISEMKALSHFTFEGNPINENRPRGYEAANAS